MPTRSSDGTRVALGEGMARIVSYRPTRTPLRTWGRITALGAAAALVLGAIPGSARADRGASGWVLSRPGATKVTAGHGYRLFDVYGKKLVHLRRGKDPRVEPATTGDDVELVSKKGGAPLCGDRVTVKVGGMALMLDPKTSEVLPTSAVDADEWAFEGCTKGSPIPLGRPIALVNLRRGDAWVGCKRHGAEAYCWDDKQLMGIATE